MTISLESINLIVNKSIINISNFSNFICFCQGLKGFLNLFDYDYPFIVKSYSLTNSALEIMEERQSPPQSHK